MNDPKTEEIARRLRGLADELSHPRASEFLNIAADRLEALEAELAALREQQRWIPVTDCPKADGRYLVTCRDVVGQ